MNISEPSKLLDIKFKIIGHIPFIAQLCVHPVVHGPPPNLILPPPALVAVIVTLALVAVMVAPALFEHQPWLLSFVSTKQTLWSGWWDTCRWRCTEWEVADVKFPSIDTPRPGHPSFPNGNKLGTVSWTRTKGIFKKCHQAAGKRNSHTTLKLWARSWSICMKNGRLLLKTAFSLYPFTPLVEKTLRILFMSNVLGLKLSFRHLCGWVERPKQFETTI